MILGVLSLLAGTVFAQTNNHSLEAGDIRMTRAEGRVEVSFALRADKKVVPPSYSLVVNPILRGGDGRRQLTPIVIRGRRSEIADLRHGMAAGRARTGEPTPLYMAPGETRSYTAALPYEEWMRGGQLLFEGVSVGCGGATEAVLGVVADNILDGGPQVETQVVEVPAVLQTTGERMAERYPFVAPASEFELLEEVLSNSASAFDDGRNEMSQRVIAQIREGSVSIFFGQGLRAIDSNFGDNNRNLVELIAAVRALASARDSKIAAIVIAGFASPEGSVGFNDRLAWDRAVAVKNFLTDNTDVDPGAIRLYNGGVDWTGLREMVEHSDLYRKARILDIVDNTPVWDADRGAGRLGELMRLDGGEPYRYMLERFFPRLRQAAYIKVYFQER